MWPADIPARQNLSRRFPGLLGKLQIGTRLDGEIVCWSHGRLDFAALQHGQRDGICFVAFEVLHAAGDDVRKLPYTQRRQLLADMTLPPPISLVESTTDRETALGWWQEYRAVGIEGLVAKRLTDPYRPGQRDWLKMRHRHTVDLIVTGITGSPSAPTGLVLSRTDDGRLRHVAVSLPLSPDLAQEVAELVTVTGTELTPVLFGLPGQQPGLQRTVEPTVIVEVGTDGQQEHGRFRHAVKVLRVRRDL